MPVITLETARLSREQKAELSEKLTADFVAVTKMPKETVYVFIKENESDNVGVGGRLLSDLHKSE